MGWVYLDDHFDEHPKVLTAGELDPLAPWLFVCGLIYCRRSDCAGLLPAGKVRTLTPLYRKRARDALVTAGLWHEVEGGAIEIHDFADWNRASRSASGKNAASVRWANERANGAARPTSRRR